MSHFFKNIFSYALLGLLWLLHFLPLPMLRGLGFCLGRLLYPFVGLRKRVVLTNLKLCFPELSDVQRQQLAKRHFVAFVCALLDRTKLWWSSRAYLSKMITMRGLENLAQAGKEPIIILTPHFVGLDAAGVGIAMRYHASSMYSRQRNPVFDAVFYAGRVRFNAPVLIERQDGLLKAAKGLKRSVPFFYLPDMDLGAKNAVFAPFFGVPAATVVGVPRLARMTGAKVVPCIARMTKRGYEVILDTAWADYPGSDEMLDIIRMNAYIETQARAAPEQYYWVHRRFKTRPPGEAKFY